MIATGYGLFIKSYMRYVKNRHMVALLTSNQIELHKVMIICKLGVFCIIGAPLTTFLLRS